MWDEHFRVNKLRGVRFLYVLVILLKKYFVCKMLVTLFKHVSFDFFFLSHFHNPPLCCLWDNQNVWRKQNYIIGLGNFYVLVCRKQKTKYSIILMTFSGSRNGIFWLFASEVKNNFVFTFSMTECFKDLTLLSWVLFLLPPPSQKKKNKKGGNAWYVNRHVSFHIIADVLFNLLELKFSLEKGNLNSF